MPEVTLPIWLFAPLLLLALAAVLDRVLVPSVRWYFRRRAMRVIDEVNTRLHIEIKPFQRTRRQVLIDRLVHDPEVQEAIEQQAAEAGLPRDVVIQRTERYANEIVPAFNAYAYFRLGYALARRLARTLYRVRLGSADEEGLAAIPPGATVVFVMNHRSNMDYVLVAYLAAERAALSYAVGEWARIWPLQTLVRSMGAYFVRRNSRDALYRKVLARYVCMATEAGVPQAVYPEGGLSRDGRLRVPKLGIVDYLLRGYQAAGGRRDLVFVPVGLNYDRTFEDRTLLLENDGAGSKARTPALRTTAGFVFRNLLQMARGRWYRFGYACVNFGTPISIDDFLTSNGLDLSDLAGEDRPQIIERLGAHLMSAVGDVVPVVPVSVVATVLTEDPARRWTLLEFKAEALEVMEQLRRTNAHLYIPRKDADYAIEVGLRMLILRRLVSDEDGMLAPVATELPVLQYYANSIAHLRRPVTETAPAR